MDLPNKMDYLDMWAVTAHQYLLYNKDAPRDTMTY